MFSQRVAERAWVLSLRAIEAKDVDELSSDWAQDIIAEFPIGLPYGGLWMGRELVRDLFTAIFAWNESVTPHLDHASVHAPMSVLGTIRSYAEWSVREVSTTGHVVDTRVVTIAESHGGQTDHLWTYYSDVPAMVRHYQGLAVPVPRGRDEAHV